MGVAQLSPTEFMLRHKEQLAHEITDELYRQMPELDEKYGARGREKCLQDMRYNLEHLAPAVDLAEPGMFANYIRWLDGLLRARNVATTELVRCLHIMRDCLGSHLDDAGTAAVTPIVNAGLAVLDTQVQP